MELQNTTDLNVLAFDQIDKPRRDCVVVLAAAAYEFDDRGSVRRSDDPWSFELTDRYYGDPKTSSVRRPTDVCYHKPRADVFFLDPVAHPPGGRACGEWPVRIQIGGQRLAFVVTGPRCWHKGPAQSWRLAPPDVCTSVPVRFEHAFGGGSRPGQDPAGGFYAENPVGLGWVPAELLKDAETIEAPRIHLPGDPPTLPNRPCGVVGITPVAPGWAPRLGRAGTYDQRWKDNDWPHYPADFDEAFFNAAPLPLQYPEFFRGGEEVRVSGLSPEETVGFRLPAFPELGLTAYCLDGERIEVAMNLDTLAIDLGRRRFGLVWRGVFAPTAQVFYSQLAFRR